MFLVGNFTEGRPHGVEKKEEPETSILRRPESFLPLLLFGEDGPDLL